MDLSISKCSCVSLLSKHSAWLVKKLADFDWFNSTVWERISRKQISRTLCISRNTVFGLWLVYFRLNISHTTLLNQPKVSRTARAVWCPQSLPLTSRRGFLSCRQPWFPYLTVCMVKNFIKRARKQWPNNGCFLIFFLVCLPSTRKCGWRPWWKTVRYGNAWWK